VSELLDSALRFAHGGTPVLAVKPRSKEPATVHGVLDATVDPDRIRSWWERWPDANIGVACGTPGPHVLDVDDPAAYRQLDAGVRAQIDEAPTVATARGHQFYFAGNTTTTIVLPFGELRGRGSYVVAPPSVHPTGKVYVWIAEPHGPLPAIPGFLAAGKKTIGAGAAPEVESIPPKGGMHEHLADLAVRLVRAGVQSQQTITTVLLAEFEARRSAPASMYGGDERDTLRIAQWAVNSDIAERERGDRTQPPELRDELAKLLRLVDKEVRVLAIRMIGNGSTAALELDLSNGLTIITEHFGDLWTHTGLAKFVTQNTGIDAGAITKNDATRANALIRQLAEITVATRTGDLGRDHGHDFLRRAPQTEFQLHDQANRYGAFAELERLDTRGVHRPEDSLVLLDERDGVRFVHCGHLFVAVQGRREVSHPGELARRMELAGWWRSGRRGRIKATSPTMSHVIVLPFWRVPAEWETA
jgi:hypothetical protein